MEQNDFIEGMNYLFEHPGKYRYIRILLRQMDNRVPYFMKNNYRKLHGKPLRRSKTIRRFRNRYYNK